MSHTRSFIAAAVLTALVCAPVAASQAGHDVSVQVTYKGKGDVSEAHPIVVMLFTNARPRGEKPLALQRITKNGEATTFKNVTASPIYVFVVYDTTGKYDGSYEPDRMPFWGYTLDGKVPAPFTPGPNAKITIDFDDKNVR